MSEKEIITTLSIVGAGAEKALAQSGADPANFVIPVHAGETMVDTSFGKIGVLHTTQTQNGSEVRIVQLDCTAAPSLLWRSPENPYHTIAVNREGTGSQQVKKKVEIFVATKHFQLL